MEDDDDEDRLIEHTVHNLLEEVYVVDVEVYGAM